MVNKNEPEYRLIKSVQPNTGTRIIFINSNPDNLQGLCIGLLLAQHNIEPLNLVADDFSLKIQLFDGKSRGRGATGYYFESNNEGRLELDSKYFDEWLGFYLPILHDKDILLRHCYFHIDWQFQSHRDVKKSKGLYFTLDFELGKESSE